MERLYPHRGGIEVICGSMFSGKTEELIKRLRRAEIARLKVQAFKPVIDQRYSKSKITSHNQSCCPSKPISHALDIWKYLEREADVIGIDEAQFFDGQLIDVVQKLAEQGLRVVIAGLDTDWQGKPFGPMPELLAIADTVSKQHAVCVVCGAPASRTQRVVSVSSRVLVGASEAYEARCRQHFKPVADRPTRASYPSPQIEFSLEAN